MLFRLAIPTHRQPQARWQGLSGAALPLALAEGAAAAPGPLAVLTRDAQQREQLETELRFFVPRDLPVLAFPDYETLPYDRFSPHPDIISLRLRTLARLPSLARGILLADLPTSLQRLPPRSFIDAHSLTLATGAELDLEAFRQRLAAAGYASVPQVATPGEFAIRGSLFDLFPMGSDAPLRIDLDDRLIDSIRSFDSDTQRTTGRLERIELLPAREFSLSAESIRDFRRRFRTRFEGDLTRMPVYRDVGDGLAPAGIEYFLPLFFASTATLFDYLPERTALVLPDDCASVLGASWVAIGERVDVHRCDI